MTCNITGATGVIGGSVLEGIVRKFPDLEIRALLRTASAEFTGRYTDVEIDKQQDVLKKTQKKLNGYLSDSTDLGKKIRNLHTDEDQNKADILKQTTEIQTNITANDDVKNKSQKKMNKLLDEQDNIRKKLRKASADLDETRNNLTAQYKETDKQQQVLDAIKAKKKM